MSFVAEAIIGHEEKKKPFKCDICDVAFIQNLGLKRHIDNQRSWKKKKTVK